MHEVAEKHRQIELSLKQARFETAHARRQYDAVDPDNRLVASELERRWNDQLVDQRRLEGELEALDKDDQPVPGTREREDLMRLGADLQLAWSHPSATMVTRKKIVRCVLHEIVVRVEANRVEMVLHWQGGDHTRLSVKKNKAGKHRWCVEESTEVLIRELARMMPDRSIAAVLNRSGKKTGRGNGWKQNNVCKVRNRLGVAVYREGERAERGETTLDEAAAILNVSPMTVLRMIRSGILEGRHLCKGAPWVIKAADIDRLEVQEAANTRRKRPLTRNPDQETFTFQ
jgi:hypothetical protein